VLVDTLMGEEAGIVFKQVTFPIGKSPDISEHAVEQFERQPSRSQKTICIIECSLITAEVTSITPIESY